SEYLQNGFRHLGVLFSQPFCQFFAAALEQAFFAATGLSPSAKVTLAGSKQHNDRPFYESGPVSRLNLVLWIMPEFTDNISFCWKSKTNRIVATTDESFDPADLIYWVEGLQPALYWKLVATEKKNHPFQSVKLPFALKVIEFGVDTNLIFDLKNTDLWPSLQSIISKVYEAYDEEGTRQYEKYGLPHSIRFTAPEAGRAMVRIDTGSAGTGIIKKILEAISAVPGIDCLTIDI
ncbi:MAG: hypothetical protein KGO82_18790, partial [Bacteroidota bacterium]|nr:hypothetical protein [Bacteroidota bacterium]